MGVGDPRKVRYPTSVGYQSLHTIPLYFLIAFTCEVGYLTEAGNPLSWGEFSPCECWSMEVGWGDIHPGNYL